MFKDASRYNSMSRVSRAGIINNCNFDFRPKFTNFIGHKCWSNNHIYLKHQLPLFSINLVFVLDYCWLLQLHYYTLHYIHTYITHVTLHLLLLCGAAQLIPGPKHNFDLPLKPCIAAQNFSTLVLFKAYNLIDKFDIICLSKTNLDSIILPDDSNLEIPGYNLVRCDHTSNNYKN